MNKTLIFGIVPRIQELHCNVKKILDLLDIEALEFSHSADIKMRKFLKSTFISQTYQYICSVLPGRQVQLWKYEARLSIL